MPKALRITLLFQSGLDVADDSDAVSSFRPLSFCDRGERRMGSSMLPLAVIVKVFLGVTLGTPVALPFK